MDLPTPSCPRCGYDLSGVVASWNVDASASCPMEGCCSECGLEFEWADTLAVTRHRVRGFYEHSRLWLAPLTAYLTWFWTLAPPRFWAKIRLEYRPRLGRLVFWVPLMLLIPWVAAGVPGMLQLWPRTVAGWHAWPQSLGEMLQNPWRTPLYGREPAAASPLMRLISRVPEFVAVGAAMSITFPLVLVGLHATRAKAKVTLRHIARASTYQLAWLVPVVIAKCLQVASGNIVLGRVVYTRPVAPSPAGIPVSQFPMPLWASVFRAYGSWSAGEAYRYWPLWIALVFLWLSWWWWSALSRGFRLSQARAIWFVAMIPTTLAAITVLFLHPSFLRHVF